MARNALALAVLVSLWPAAAFPNAPPPDPYWPCEGRAAEDPCSVPGCTCVEAAESGGFQCPPEAAACLACQHPDGSACPLPYDGPGMLSGCGCGTPALSSLAGLAAVLLLLPRRTRRRPGP